MQNNIDNQNLVTEKLIEENRELNSKCAKLENSFSKQQNTQPKINSKIEISPLFYLIYYKK
jgi:hypothetical protein